MSDLVGNPEDRFSHNEAKMMPARLAQLVECLGLRSGVCRFNFRVRHILSLVVSKDERMVTWYWLTAKGVNRLGLVYFRKVWLG